MRLDHYIARVAELGERKARLAIVSGEVLVDGETVTNHLATVDHFQAIHYQDRLLQPARERLYLKLHKPVGYISATSDPEHPTALDLISHPGKQSLHLAGRLDRSSSGLLLLTNDSQWSEALAHPRSKVEKVYLVETQDPISDDAVSQFAQGFYFETEGVTTLPAKLEILDRYRAKVILHEGKYHQIKRMFYRMGENRLRSLHRIQIGPYHLDDLNPGEFVAIE